MAAAETPWHAFDVADVARRLGSDPDRGLTAAEAGRRLAAHGPNALDEPPPDPLWRKVIGQFRELVIWILLVAAGIAAVLGDWADAAAIVAIVPGDRIEIEAGDQVPADARLVEAFGLHLQEAALTGESEPVEKAPGDALAAETPLGDRRTMVHAGTVVAAGRGAALVVATGMRTELGRIAGLLERSPPETTPLQRRLAELGRVTVICSDKTGTLTRNQMTVREVVTAGGRLHVSGAGYEPKGAYVREGGQTVTAADEPGLAAALEIAARCGSATVEPGRDGGGWQVVGDPTEGALVVAAVKGGLPAADPSRPVIFEFPFDSERKRMSVVVRVPDGGRMMMTKGATEAVLPRCVSELRDMAVVPLTDDRRRELLAAAAEMAARALRVLSLARRDVPAGEQLDAPPDAAEHGLVHVGLVGIIDPPREEARAAVARCRTAGVRPVMITGDHPATALAIGRELDLADPGAGRVATGAELDAIDDEQLAAEVQSIAVYARVSAEHKLRVVRAWQRRGEIVAMTGVGVNDAPAVKAADIGIAMGIAGTDVTKEASDMVLTDDNFASIVTAMEEGRGIYDNIQKFIHYLLSCNAGEVLTMFVAALAGWPAPLAAIQILWLNLVTDGLPALALGLEPPEQDIMERPPRPPHEPVITRGRGILILAHGGLVAAVILGAFWSTWRGDDARLERARTVAFCVAAFAQLFFAIGCRSDRVTVVRLGFLRNPALLLAILLSSLLQVVIVSLAPARAVFEVERNVGGDWAFVFGLALVPVTVIEVAKWAAVPLTRRRPCRLLARGMWPG